MYCCSLLPVGYFWSLLPLVTYFIYPVIRFNSLQSQSQNATHFEDTLITLNATVMAVYFLHVIKKSNTLQFAQLLLNEQVTPPSTFRSTPTGKTLSRAPPTPY